MTARTHDAFAFASLVVVASYIQPESISLMTLFSAVVANNIGALIPDMDSAGNRLWDLLPAGDQVGKVFRRVFYKHRTLSHSILGTIGIYKILEFILPKLLNPNFVDAKIILLSIMVGYVSHLMADMLTTEGLPLFFPFKFNFGIPPVSALRIKTGGKIEKLLIYPGVWVFLFIFIYTNQEQLKALIQLVN